MTDGEEWVPAESDREEPELARIGRLLLAHEIDRRVYELREVAGEVVDAAFDGEDVTREDVKRLRNGIENLEFCLRDYVDPVVEDGQEPAVDLADVTGEAVPPEVADD